MKKLLTHSPMLDLARIWSLVSILFILFFVVGEGLTVNGVWPTPDEWVGIAFFPVGLLLGLLISWRNEGFGGFVGLLSTVGFYIWNFASNGSFVRGPFIILLAAPSLLFMVYWIYKDEDRRHNRPT